MNHLSGSRAAVDARLLPEPGYENLQYIRRVLPSFYITLCQSRHTLTLVLLSPGFTAQSTRSLVGFNGHAQAKVDFELMVRPGLASQV
jgi:cAMP phosphodiesterase